MLRRTNDTLRSLLRNRELLEALNAKPTLSDEAFSLYETFGMPLDFMVDAARDAGIGFDHGGF